MSLKKISSIIALLLSFLYTIIQTTSTPTYIGSDCSNTTIFANNTKYHTNLNTLFGSLANATSNPLGFGINSIANGTSDAVYGLFLCRGDQNAAACSDCVKAATTKDLPKTYCPNRKVAAIWYDECMLRYTNKPILGVMEQSPEISLANLNYISRNPTQFNDILENTMRDLVTQIANINSGKKYATKMAELNSSSMLYALGQCTPDLSTSDCNQCLRIAIGKLTFKIGARVLQPSCLVRCETYQFYNGDINISLPLSRSPSPGTNSTSTGIGNAPYKKLHIGLGISSAIASISLTVNVLFICCRLRRKVRRKPSGLEEIQSMDSLQIEYDAVKTATYNFSEANKLGQGGFGIVYMGTLADGQAVAVKRLSNASGQGIREFKTEACLAAKLQHKNLVKVYGFCLERIEMLLVYEFVPNKSLDRFLFDVKRKIYLKWETRYKIIVGIARGLLYLHEDSSPKIIHRDLKPSNILLDAEMNPKIADFGMAKLFGGEQTQGNTSRIAGTFGYMAPEYALSGHFSVKSDVFSYGVLLLEIISGMKNRNLDPNLQEEDLLSYVWRLWNEGTLFKLVDIALENKFSRNEVGRCIQVGLLCTQEDPVKRPNMDSILIMLNTQLNSEIPSPTSPPAFSYKQEAPTMSHGSFGIHMEDVVSELSPR